MASKIFLIGRHRINADITFLPYGNTGEGEIVITELKHDIQSEPQGAGMTSGERQEYYNQVLGFACTLPHGFTRLRPYTDFPGGPY